MADGLADLGALIQRPLCVRCRRCGRKHVFGSTSPQAREAEGAVAARLKCRNCGARGGETLRLCDDREAQRWLADR